MKATIIRTQSDDKQTLGHFTLYDDVHDIYHCKTLELCDKKNEVRKSRIPAGMYNVKKHKSPSQGWCFSVVDVPGRTNILIHKGNYNTDILGCILVGKSHTDINGDGEMDVTSSTYTLNEIMGLTDKFWMKIIDFDFLT